MARRSLPVLIALLVLSSVLAVGTAAGQSPEEGRPPEPGPGEPVDQEGEPIDTLVTYTEDVTIQTGNTPMLRLLQDGTSGFTPQTWDVAGNEASFFIRDVTNGSTLPFRIYPGAGSGSLVIANDSQIGIGTTGPDARLEVTGAGDAQILVDDNGSDDKRTLFVLENNGIPVFRFENATDGTVYEFALTRQGGFQINEVGSQARFVFQSSGGLVALNQDGDQSFNLRPTGNLEIAGVLTESSDVAAKTNLVPVNSQSVLEQVATLPLFTWRYTDSRGIHLGPMAQDFHEAFGLGHSPTGIASLDTSGVALASVQALYELNQEQAAYIETLEERIAALEAAVEALTSND